MTTELTTHIDENGNEVRTYLQHGLMCPNPREYYRMTRSYEDMRLEHDLLHPWEPSDLELQLIFARIKASQIPNTILFFPMIIPLIFLLLMVFCYWRF